CMCGALTIAGYLLVFSWSSAAQDLDKINIGSSTISFSPFSTYYAVERDFFKREGLDPTITIIKTEAAIAALNAGELDYTTFSSSIIDAALSGFPLRLLAVIVQQPVQGLVVQEEITEVSDLKGKKVGISSFGGLTYAAAVEVLKHYGLNVDDVKLLAVGRGPLLVAGLKNRGLDAAFISAPHDIKAVRQGFKVLLQTGDLFKFPYGGFSTSVAKIRENPSEVEKALRAVLGATKAVVDPTNKRDVVQFIAKFFKLDHDAAIAFYDRLIPALNPSGIVTKEVIQRAIDRAVEKGLTDQPLDPDQITDFSFARKLS
ncbi:MAG: ABC transporter substrate-binding protein, partial [Candidatus Binatia bacterium]